MYPDGLRQLIEGWTKNLASGVRLVDPVMSAIAVWWMCACIAVTVHAVRALAGGPDGVAMALVSSAVVACQLRWMWRRVGSFGWWTALTYPIAISVFVVLFVRSAWATLVKRRVSWSGRPIELASRRAG